MKTLHILIGVTLLANAFLIGCAGSRESTVSTQMPSSQAAGATNSVSDVIQQVTAAWNADVLMPLTTPFDSSPDSRAAYLKAY